MRKALSLLVSVILIFFLYKFNKFYTYKKIIDKPSTSELAEYTDYFLIYKGFPDSLYVSELKKFLLNNKVDGAEEFSELKVGYLDGTLYGFGYDGDDDRMSRLYDPLSVNFLHSFFKNGDNIFYKISDFDLEFLNNNTLYRISENGVGKEKINAFRVYCDQLKSNIKLKRLYFEEKNALIKIKGDSILVLESNLSQESIKLFKLYFNKYKNRDKDNPIYIIRLNTFNIEDLDIEGDSLKYYKLKLTLDNDSN
jgi:hypothetical protein